MCVFSLITLYSQTPGSTLLPVFQKTNKIEKKDRQTDEHHIKKKRKKEEKRND
jgi:phage portal protein BeeE